MKSLAIAAQRAIEPAAIVSRALHFAMQSPTSVSFAARDRYPACLRLAGQATPVATAALALQLTLHFGSQWESLLDGRVRFALRGLCLHFQGDGDWQPELARDFNLDSGAHLQAIASDSPALWSCQISLVSGEQALAGSSELLTLGQWQAGSTLSVAATAAPADVAIAAAEGLWPHDITPNQHAALERRLAVFLAREYLAPYLSRMQHQTEASSAPAPNPPAAASLDDLRTHLQAVLAEPSASLLALVELAGLAPATDLAGGNLRGADLRGLDLSGADLSRANLRGADLSDADLSDADLRGARLGGADLSGAFLSNADLRGCDLHRASLALANLGGADLREANLLAANLSNTSWSNTRVTGAQFDRNPGLTAELQASLVERGAQLVLS